MDANEGLCVAALMIQGSLDSERTQQAEAVTID